jgi:hypothetical protein
MEYSRTIGTEIISLLELRPSEVRGCCLSLHGGGPSSKETSDYLAPHFLQRGISFCSFDFSGQGKSSGSMQASSLKKRTFEAKTIMESLGVKTRFLVGTSMGGYIATKIIADIEIENLILFCPAAYSTKAWELEFGNGFTEEIRRENSFLETDAKDICSNYRGNVLVIFGSEDPVVPEMVKKIYLEGFRKAKTFKKLILPECPHPVHRWIQDKKESKVRLMKEVEQFVRICT